ncbi:soluble inorganic pyrophosphatase 6, chloroplastic-like [Camellia sinensis]|uniref:soluble inorganic pyrophosphatase 6, chloroplastic-like n=1 Tax=Camellia sinensis TaxID=4442 RepID=UPI001036C8AE|nr:soluble inorganic pyrophosphatase 6, chloroplastic-like [Camellia sinensis]
MVSPWHDIPLHLGDGVFNFIVEIPKETSAKMEVATDESYTPIKQYTKKGKLRYYPYNINWNYGLFPQMWEDPSFANSEVEGALGDNDPVDVVEIGQTRGKIGQIMKVKPLAALAMLDEGELDWKIVAISLDDPRASLVNDIDDVDKHLPSETGSETKRSLMENLQTNLVLATRQQTRYYDFYASINLHCLDAVLTILKGV